MLHALADAALAGSHAAAVALRQGAGLMGLLWHESRQSLPPELLIPAGMCLVAVAADFLRKGGMEVTDEDVAGGIEALVTALLQAGGVDPEKVAQIGERGGKSDGTMPAPKTGAAAEGEA